MPEAIEIAELRQRALDADAATASEIASQFSDADLKKPEVGELVGIARYKAGDTEGGVSLLVQVQGDGRYALDPRAQIFVMRSRYAAGDEDAALLSAKRVLAGDPSAAEAMRTAARICNRRQEWDRAERFWRELCDASASDPEAALQVARIAARREEYETAAYYADRHLKAWPDHAEALILFIEGAQRSGGAEGVAAKLAALYAVDADRAVKLSRKIDGFAPLEQAEILKALGGVAQGDEVAAEVLSRAGRVWVRKALDFETAQNDPEAAPWFRAALTLDPDSRIAQAGIRRLRADAVVAMRDAAKAANHEEVVKTTSRVVEIDPGMDEAWLTMGRSLMTLGQHAPAAAALQKAVAIAPDNAWLNLNLARALERAEQFPPALEAYSTVGRLIADAEDAHRVEADRSSDNIRRRLIKKGRDLYRAGELNEAWTLFDFVVRAGGDTVDAEPMREAIRRELFLEVRDAFNANADNLRPLAEAYLAKDPENGTALLYLGRRLMQERNHTDAFEVWTRLTDMEPENAHYWLQLARCCDWLRRPEAGHAAAVRALELDPSVNEAETLRGKFAAKL